MKLPPYGKTVEATAPGYWDRGTRVVIFAGPRAWDWCKGWLDVALEEIPQARHRYTLILPPDQTANADVFRWPVEGRGVVIVLCGGEVSALDPLIETLRRDGCADGEVIEASALHSVLGWCHALRLVQPWSWATFDGEVMRAYAEAQQKADEQLVRDFADVMGELPELWGALAEGDEQSLGRAVLAELALRAKQGAAEAA